MHQSVWARLKNAIWAIGIALCLVVLAGGLLVTMFRRYNGYGSNYTLNLSNPNAAGDVDVINAGYTDTTESFMKLEETDDAGEEYIARLTFLCDSTLIGLRDYGILNGMQVWGTSSGSYPVSSFANGAIKFPNDGSEIPAQSCAMIAQPDVLVIAVGTDGLDDVKEDSFKQSYRNLITGIKSVSPDTVIICCSLTSVTADYNGASKLDELIISEATDWIIDVCEETGVYFADIATAVGDGSGLLLSSCAAANGKGLNSTGLDKVLEYLRTHAVKIK